MGVNLYPCLPCGKNAGSENGVLLSSRYKPANLERGLKDRLTTIEEKLRKLGFQVDIRGNWYSTHTGNTFNLIYDTERNEIIVCFMGIGNHEVMNISDAEKEEVGSQGIFTIVADWIGGIPAATKEAIKIGEILKKATAESDITPVLVGHSHGGGMAQAGACANGIKGIAFNSRPMGAGVRRYIGQSKIAKNAKHITTFSVKGDWLTDIALINILGIIFERLTGIAVQRSAGTGYYLPEVSAHSRQHNHVCIYESFRKLKKMPNTADI